MIIPKCLLIILFGLIFIQDLKERQVYWFLFPLVGILSGYLFYISTLPELFIASIVLNAIFVSLMLLSVILYSNLILKIKARDAFGLGDALLFLSLIFSFSSVSFLVIFVFGLLFSLVIHLILKQTNTSRTVPLAGYLSLFFGLSYLAFWTGLTDSLYAI